MANGNGGNGSDGAGVGWYGKIPAAGDFVHRRLPRVLIAWWDAWLQYGLAALRQMPDEGAERGYAAAPIWNFAIPAGPGAAGMVQLGCIAPSRDRVGRAYPLCAATALPAQVFRRSQLEGADDYYRRVGASLLAAVRHGCAAEQLDRMLQEARLSGDVAAAVPGRAGAAAAADEGGAAARAGNDILEILNAGNGAADGAGAVGDDGIGGTAGTPRVPPALAAWPDLPFCFNPSSHTSYWWTNQSDGAALQTYVHGGALNATLFLRLFCAPPAWRRL